MPAFPAFPAAVGVLKVGAAVGPARLGGHGAPDPVLTLGGPEAEGVAERRTAAALSGRGEGSPKVVPGLTQRPTPVRPVQTLLHTPTRPTRAAFRGSSGTSLPASMQLRLARLVVPSAGLTLLKRPEAARATGPRPHPRAIMNLPEECESALEGVDKDRLPRPVGVMAKMGGSMVVLRARWIVSHVVPFTVKVVFMVVGVCVSVVINQPVVPLAKVVLSGVGLVLSRRFVLLLASDV